MNEPGINNNFTEFNVCILLGVILAGKQKKTTKKLEVKKSKQPSLKKGAGASTSQDTAASSSQAAPAAKPKRYSSQRQRQTQQVPLPVHQSMMPQMGAMYPDHNYYEQMGELVWV